LKPGKEVVVMPTILKHPGAGTAHHAPPAPTHEDSHRWLVVAMGVVVALLVGLTTWTVVDRLTGGSETVATPSSSSAARLDSYSILRVVGLQQTLRGDGYAIAVTGTLDPVTLSAAADFTRVDAAHPLEPWLAATLSRTVITGRRDPGAWNARFGAERITQMAERPLTGQGGQLDAYGNLTG
jgi:hypothetical protein